MIRHTHNWSNELFSRAGKTPQLRSAREFRVRLFPGVATRLTGASLLLFFAALPWHLRAQQSDGPSFSCAHVTSQVNRLICSSPHLATLDRELALVFNNMQGQPVDHKHLHASEDAWLAAMHRDCQDATCVESRYMARLRALRDVSLQVASPAAYEETRPFPAPDSIRLKAEESVGKPCTTRAGLVDASIPGFQLATSFLPVFGTGYVIVVRQSSGHLFAFLISSASSSEGCLVRDEIALPPILRASRFLQCSNAEPPLTGFGIRDEMSALIAFWTIDATELGLQRVPTRVMGIETTIRCRQPESAD